MSKDDEIYLWFRDLNMKVRFWESYSFSSDFLSASDSWSFTAGDKEVCKELNKTIQPGTRVSLVINDSIQSTGYVDKVSYEESRDSGSKFTVSGRDALGILEDACINPRLSFDRGDDLESCINKAMYGLGFYVYTEADNELNRSIITGINPKRTLKGRKVKDYQLEKSKPKFGDGVYEYLDRTVKRYGLHLWINQAGDKLILSAPNFDQAPEYKLVSTESFSNVISKSLSKDWSKQLDILVVVGKGGGENYSKSKLKAAIVNEFTGYDTNGELLPEVKEVLRQEKIDPKNIIAPNEALFKLPKEHISRHRPQFIEDANSVNQNQLDAFARRTLAQYQYKAFVVNYTVEGHTQNGHPWAIDTVVDVRDDAFGLAEPMWIGSRTFTKSRGSGTTTSLTLHRLHTLRF